MKVTDYYGKLSDEGKLIADFDLNKTHGDECWTNLLKTVVNWRKEAPVVGPDSVLGFVKDQFERLEIATLTEMQLAGVPDLVTKKGKWKLSKVCSSSTYRSAKSVIINAIKMGIPLEIGSELRAKTSVESSIKRLRKQEAAGGPDIEHFVGQICKVLSNAKKQLSDLDYELLKTAVRDAL